MLAMLLASKSLDVALLSVAGFTVRQLPMKVVENKW
jgi:hypothetical protein